MVRQIKNKNRESLSVGLRIRYEVINSIYRNPNLSVQLPSSAEFARKFNISQRTATRELKKLADEGYVTGKHGIGTFTNPTAIRFLADSPGKNIIGIICGDGRQFFDDYVNWAFMSYTGLALPPDIGHPRHFSVTSSNPDLIYEELCSLNLDGIIWINPPEDFALEISKLHKNGWPIITMLNKIPEIPYIGIDIENCGKEIGKHLLKSGKKQILWCAFDDKMEIQIMAAIKVLRDNGHEIDESLIVSNWSECEDKLTALLKQNKIPDCIFTHGESIYPILSIFEHYRIEPYDKCSFVAEKNSIRRIPDFKGITCTHPFEEMGNQAAQWMQLLLDDPFALNDKSSLWKVKVDCCM